MILLAALLSPVTMEPRASSDQWREAMRTMQESGGRTEPFVFRLFTAGGAGRGIDLRERQSTLELRSEDRLATWERHRSDPDVPRDDVIAVVVAPRSGSGRSGTDRALLRK